MHFVADDDAQPGRALQAVRLDIPAGAAQQLVACRRERGEVRHVTAGDEADAGSGRQPEQIDQPRPGHLFDDGRGGGEDVETRRLIPDRGEPLGGDRRRQGTAGHEAEVAGSGGRHESGFCPAGQRLDDGGGIDRIGGQRTTKRAPEPGESGGWPDGTNGSRGDVLAREIERTFEAGLRQRVASVFLSHVTIA